MYRVKAVNLCDFTQNNIVIVENSDECFHFNECITISNKSVLLFLFFFKFYKQLIWITNYFFFFIIVHYFITVFVSCDVKLSNKETIQLFIKILFLKVYSFISANYLLKNTLRFTSNVNIL